MSIIRSLAASAAATAAFAALVALPTSGRELIGDPGDVFGWWESHGTASATIGLVHLAALVAATYVAAVLAAVALASILRLPGAAIALARFAPGSIRRHLAVGVVAGSLLAPTTAGAQDAIVIVDVGPEAPATAPITVVDLGEADPLVDTEHAETTGLDGTPEPVSVTSSFRESFRGAAVAATPDAWLVESGDNLWSIAESVMRDHHDGAVEHAAVASYWRSLIAANTDALADPDLIFPGQVVNLPPVVTAGS